MGEPYDVVNGYYLELVYHGQVRKVRGPLCILSGAIDNLVITSNYRGEYMLCEGYVTKITISGLIACWITA